MQITPRTLSDMCDTIAIVMKENFSENTWMVYPDVDTQHFNGYIGFMVSTQPTEFQRAFLADEGRSTCNPYVTRIYVTMNTSILDLVTQEIPKLIENFHQYLPESHGA